MRIIGAGMAGLLAANMLRRHKPVIFEKKDSLPFNHSAVLRFRNEEVSRATGIPFKKVKVQKAVVDCYGRMHTRTDLRLSNMYAQKVTGRVQLRSVMNLDPVERFIAPPDFIEQMSKCVDIQFGSAIDLDGYKPEFGPVISTMPMPELMKQVGWEPRPRFEFSKVWIVTAEIESPLVDIYQTIYFPDPKAAIYRASITGNRIILEFIEDPCGTLGESVVQRWISYFGIVPKVLVDEKVVEQKYGKISPIDDRLRKNFIYQQSERSHIYSLGRFATWRNILLDDLIHDIQFIDNFIAQRDLYSASHSTIR